MTERDRLAAAVKAADPDCFTQPGIVADRLIAAGWTDLPVERLARALHRVYHNGVAGAHTSDATVLCDEDAAAIAAAYREDAVDDSSLLAWGAHLMSERTEPCWNCGHMTTFTVDEDGTPRNVKPVEPDLDVERLARALATAGWFARPELVERIAAAYRRTPGD